MRVSLDRTACVGHGRCHFFAPEVFALDDAEGRAILLVEQVANSSQAAALKGARSCPEQAVAVIDETGRGIWPPSAATSNNQVG